MSEHATTVPADRNRRTAMGLFAMVAVVLVAAFGAVPLYALFHRAPDPAAVAREVTGAAAPVARQMTASFDASVDKALPWTVTPASAVTDPLGTTRTVIFKATSTADVATTGKAVFSVTPPRAARYVVTTHCFCAEAHTLAPGESKPLAVTFFVDPKIAGNDDLHTVKDITLSYTFYADDKKGS